MGDSIVACGEGGEESFADGFPFRLAQRVIDPLLPELLRQRLDREARAALLKTRHHIADRTHDSSLLRAGLSWQAIFASALGWGLSLRILSPWHWG